ncbi:MAG: hypothetical protein ACRC4W_01440 [Treponemataceae bacterium]
MRLKKILQASKTFIFLFLSKLCFSQTQPAMPSIESPVKPEMPTLSTPFKNQTKKNTATQSTNNQQDQKKQPMNMAMSLVNNMLGQNTNDLLGGILNQQNQNSSNDVLLQQIILQLETLQKKIDGQANAPANATNEQGKFIRFFVNNQNLIESFDSVYFSKKSPNGDFLISVDRRYTANQKNRSETFYLLLKKTGANEYTATIDISQDYQNEKSFLYQLANEKNLIVTQFGNSYILKHDSPNLQCNMLFERLD